MGRLEYHVGPKDASAAVATPVALESGKASAKRTPAPVAKQMSVVPTAHAAAGIGKRRNSKRRKPAKASPHRKWERTANTIDEIIKGRIKLVGRRLFPCRINLGGRRLFPLSNQPSRAKAFSH